jgi:hypothetical protein
VIPRRQLGSTSLGVRGPSLGNEPTMTQLDRESGDDALHSLTLAVSRDFETVSWGQMESRSDQSTFVVTMASSNH